MIRPQIFQQAVNDYWRIRSQTDDAFYFGLGDRIKQRQESAIPVAGAGTVQFLSLAGDVSKGIGFVFPPFRKIAAMFEFAEQIARDESGLTK